jgi:CRP-like cAMP-binding protein
MMQVGVLNAGKSFGELALTKGAPRAATIVCKEETHFVTLSRDKFNKFLCKVVSFFD